MNTDNLYLINSDCTSALKDLPDCSVDAVVTDPPYELGFMGKTWDASGIAYSVDLWREVLRVLKPGGHLLSFGGTRTYHRMTCAIEDAGFEIRDSLHWMYGTGFPKSLNVSKAIDDAAGVEGGQGPMKRGGERLARLEDGKRDGKGTWGDEVGRNAFTYAPGSDAAKQWDGWGTALKPGHEPIVLARKPLDGTVAANVQNWGTGGLNIDGCRIGTETRPVTVRTETVVAANAMSGTSTDATSSGETTTQGRWPANVLLDEDAARELDAQSGERTSGKMKAGTKRGTRQGNALGTMPEETAHDTHGDSGGASRFFYVAKPSKAERNKGCDALPAKTGGEATDREDGSAGVDNPRAGAGRTGGAKNFHPTVKPIELMRYLCRLVTPPGGIVLDPFLGSGTTGMAAVLEGFEFIGIEKEPEYLEIAKARISATQPPAQGETSATAVPK